MIHIIICDDCLNALEIIKSIVEQFYNEIGFKEFIIKTFNSSEDTITYTEKNYDKEKIYILDIDLNEEKNGLLLGREIRKLDDYKSEIIFVTNNVQMAFKVFQYKLRVLEFIDKNYNLDIQLKESILIATKILTKTKEESKEKLLQVKFGIQIFNIPLKDIIYFETIKSTKKLLLVKANSRLEFYGTLKEIKNSLDDNFIQVHKTTIINKNHIRSINKEPGNPYLELDNDMQCFISKSGLKEVTEQWP
ncbi:LytR/AlgR family response regulator transcription factor [Clostridium estertheticum]|uniref:LytR/AlgR family response regulator transcription factor n=1 Tax=Clostridium estertheticum TaxID=238834 RepID=UPI00124D7177|nr:LytTR family DNA-binding domain-containing protein [Clostridium estertheticum]MBZ9618522.1 LytTR family DNA-binding domain-containing protein [Clostridium estertheticum subsp. laramiense]MCB2362285.1 LytTR family DNA-binding domain-containing protein [Clostridium estertheticum]WAG76448.1 LytTR family DNA-binding domain-containing protein [Clostridium estertheticum]